MRGKRPKASLPGAFRLLGMTGQHGAEQSTESSRCQLTSRRRLTHVYSALMESLTEKG